MTVISDFGRDKPVALITGATSGIGLALAKRLAPRYALVLTGRRTLAEVVRDLPPGALYVEADQRNARRASDAVVDVLQAHRLTRVDRVVLNAGLGFYRPPEAETEAMIAETMQVNLLAPIVLAHALVPHLLLAAGRLTLIGSVAHKQAARAPSYAASKAGLNGFARALEEEWRGRIAVQIIHPGPVATAMHAKAGFEPGWMSRLFLSNEAAAGEIARLIETGRSPVTVSKGTKIKRLILRQDA